MVRRKTLATALLGIFTSQAFALGLGNIRIKSYLDQPLDAEIEVLASSPKEVASLKVMLAPPEAYARAGIERAYFHNKLRFRVEKRPDGKTIIHVTSKEPVREPFLDFLVEANWGSGQIVREYTLLVDPPVLMQAPPPAVKAPVASAPPAPPPPASSPRAVTSATSVPAAPLAGTYGPTQRNETLWKIAERVRPSSDVTIQQVMLALLEANPEAFYNANINNLKAGYVLRIPSLDEIRAIGRAEAVREFRRQMAEWRSGVARPGGGKKVSAATPSGTGESTASSVSDTGETAGAEQARLKLVAPAPDEAAETGRAAGAGGGAEGKTLEELKEELALANEAIEAQEQQNARLNERLRRLEEQVEKLHRLLELKDSELARLQQSVPSEAGAGVAAPAGETTSAPSIDQGEGEAAPQPSSGEAAAPTPAGETPQASEAVPAESTTPEASEQLPAGMEEEIIPDEEMEEAPEPGLTERLLTDPVYQAIGGGILLFLLLLLWMARRGRKAPEGGFEESILQERAATETAEPAAEAPKSEPEPVAEAAGKVDREAGPQTDSSLFTDFAVSGMDAMREEAEADPLAEADVYLAYGRYQQAEELIRSVIEKEPENLDLYVKLLEVLYAARNQAAFDSEAEAFLARLGNPDDPRWQRVVEMGQDLSPRNPLYSGEAAGEGEEPEAPSEEASASEPEPEREEAGVIDFEPELRPLDLGEETQEAPAAADEALEPDLTAGAEREPEASLPEEEGALAPLDEVATKLDLARAYMEMGDPEGARSILQEVLEEGSREQKEEAETLLREVG